MKYPIGIQDFKSIIDDGYLYIDKTALVYDLVKKGKIYFLSRPRRFGKSLLVSTLEYYFKGRKELFQGLAIDRLEKEWVSYPVFHIDFNSTNFNESSDTLQKLIEGMVETWEKEYGYTGNRNFDAGKRFSELVAHIHKTTGQRCVVLVDEYDKPLLDVMGTSRGATADANGDTRTFEEINRNILKAFYSSFKAADAHLQFVLLTGVTKFSQVSVFSGFNQPKDISMDSRYDTLCGISKAELESYLHDEIACMANELSVSYDELMHKLQDRYDGYHFSERMVDIFNPFSILNALDSHKLSDYWFKTGTPTYLVHLLNHRKEHLNDLTGRYYMASEFVDYKADVERPLPMFYQSGYLTIKAYDEITESYLLDLPNNEVKRGFITALANNYFETPLPVATELNGMIHAITDNDLGRLRNQLTAFFASIPYSMRRKADERERERYFHYTFYLIFRLLSTYVVLNEKEQSQGRADCIIETPQTVSIFEFKLDGSAEEALRQIDRQGYARPYAADHRTVYRVGVSFSSERGTISEWKVERN